MQILKNQWLRRVAWVTAAVVSLGAVAWLGLPLLLKSQAEQRGSELLGRKLTLGAVDFKPWTLELSVSDIRLASADDQFAQLSIARAYVDASIQSLWRLAPVVDAIAIDKPQVRLSHLGEGRLDVDDVLQRLQSKPDAAPAEPLRFALHNLVLTDGSVDFSDQVGGAARAHALKKLNVSLPFISNFDSQREVTVQPKLAFELNGSSFDSDAQATPFAATRKGEMNLQLTRLDIAPYLPYLPASLPVRIRGAVLDSTLKLSFEQAATNTLLLSGTAKVSDIQITDKADAPLLSAESLQLVLKEVRPLEQRIALESLELNTPRFWVSRNRAGQLSLPGMEAAKADAPEAKAPAQPEQTGWNIAVDRIRLQGGQVRFTDASVSPTAQFALTDTQIELRDLQWPMAQPAQFELAAQLQAASAEKSTKDVKAANGGKAASLQLAGAGTATAGSATLKLADVGLPMAQPYLAAFLQPQVQGVLEGELVANWSAGALQLQSPRLAVRELALTVPKGNSALTDRELPRIKLLEVRNVAADWNKRALTLGTLKVDGARARIARSEDGQFMFSKWLVSDPAAPQVVVRVPAKPAAAWSVALAELQVDDGTVVWVDRVPSKTVFLELSGLQSRIKNVTLHGKKPAPLSLSAKVRSARTDPGSLRFDGSVMWDPLVAEGNLQLSQFPAQAVAPYGMGRLKLEVVRADTSFKGQLRFASLPAGPDLQLRGDGSIEEFRVNSLVASAATATLPATRLPGATDSPAPGSAAASLAPSQALAPALAESALVFEELLNWKALSVPGIALRMAPGAPLQLTLREVSLSDFFARLIINPEGRLVLQDLVGGDRPQTASAAVAAVPQAGASAAATAQVPAEDGANAPVIDIGTIRLINGRVAFSDRFIKPNYSANLTELAGSLSHFRSQSPGTGVQMADLELRGRAEGTASLEIAGKVNPLAKPLALDVTAKVRDLELSPLSSYAIKYAGYGIERGKLSVDLRYTVSPDGQLQASNQIVLNQLVFGDAVEGAPNSLPVKLAVSLLADSNGVIDLNLPVSGSLSDPQFRIWPIVWKVVGNLIAQALTSPFRLLSGLLGGDAAGDTLSHVAFDTGTARLTAAGQQGLDKLAQALRDKPSLRLTMVGTASLERESEALKRERLRALLLAEKRRAAATAAKDVTAVADVTAEESPALLKEVYRRSSIRKPRNMVGLTKDLPPAEMEALLLASLRVDDDAARELALSRSIAVRDYLTRRELPSDRLFLGKADTAPSAADWQPRVELNIERK